MVLKAKFMTVPNGFSVYVVIIHMMSITNGEVKGSLLL